MKLPQFCIDRPVFTVVLSLIIVVVGLIGFIQIPVRGYPNVNPPVISVSTTYNGASASTIESQITTPIENALVGSSGLNSINSHSEQGKSVVILKYDLNQNIDSAFNDVQNRLAKIQNSLPENVDNPVIQKRDPNNLQLMVLALSDPSMSPMALTDYANRNVLPQLEQVLGVGSIDLYNDRDYAMKILLNPAKMAANNVTVSDMTNILQQQNVNVPSGQIKTPSRYYSVVAKGQLANAKSFSDLIIREQNGYMLRFSDVAQVQVGPESDDTAMRVNGKPAVGLGVYAIDTANPIVVAKSLNQEIAKIQSNFPDGMKLQVVWNNTDYLKATLHEVYKDIGIAILLVIAVVTLFLGSMRSALIPIVTIPICLVGTCALIYFLGYSINVFTLLALVLAIGLVVDDAIVMLENIYRYIEVGMSPYEAAIKGSKEIAFPIVAMTLTLAAVYAPIGFTSGMTGIVFRQFAFTLALAVILSGFVALTLSPMMSGRILRAATSNWLDHFFHKLTTGYQSILKTVLNNRIWVLLGLLIIMVIGVMSYKSLPTQLAPKEDMGAFLVSIESPPNASFDYTNQYTQRIEAVLQKMPQVKNVLMVVQSPEQSFGFAILKPWSQRNLSAQQLMAEFLQKTKDIPGGKVGAFNVSQLGGGGRYGDSLRVAIMTNQSYLQLNDVVKNIEAHLNKYPGVRNVDQDLEMNNKQYVIHIHRSVAASLGVNVADVTQTLQTMLGGSTVTQFNWDNRDYDVLLQVPLQDLSQLQIINQLYVRSNTQKMIPLASLATITPEVGPQELPHQNRMRSDTLTMQISNHATMGEVINYLQNYLHSSLPQGYQFQFTGVAKQLMESNSVILASFALALVFIYLVLSAQFESFIDPFIIMLTVPFSIFGALFTLKMTGQSLSIYTNIGFITLIGLIAKHGILITEFANQQMANGKEKMDAIVTAAAMRLRPILMTTAAMVFGAIPLAIASGAGALSRQAIGWVIVGGLLFGTFFSLVVVPVAYSYLKRS